MTFPNQPLPDFINVQSPGTAILRMPVGDFTYYELWLYYTESGSPVSVANMKTAIEEITIEVENRVQWRMTATELFAVNEHHGVAAVAGWVPLFLALPQLLTQVPKGADIRDALAWGTGDVSSLVVKVKLASGRTDPALLGYAMGIPTNQPLGKILQYLPTTLTADANNTYKRVQSFEEQTERPIVAVYMQSADVTHFNYKISRDDVFEDLPVDFFNQLYDSRLNLGSVSGFAIMDFAWTGQPNRDAQPLIIDGTPLTNQQFAFKMSTAASVATVIELLGERG